MREYDENIRQYAPILQRIIILVAVIIAVPVVLWTITAFVRSYVGPPQLPTFRPLAANQAPANQLAANTAPAPQTSAPVQVAAQTGNTVSDARTLLEVKKPQSSDTPQTAPSASAAAMSAPATPGVNAPAASRPPQQTAAATPDLAAPADSAPTPSPSVAAVAAPINVPPPPFAATRSTSATVAAPPNAALASAGPPQAATVQAATSSWPNPATITPSLDAQPASLGTPSGQTAANDNAADDLPAGTPLKGKIPLPTRRPGIAGSTNMAAHVALAAGGVPLPRARPASAPEPAPVVDTPAAYDPSQIH